MASHVTHTFREKFARNMLPFNYAIGTPSGSNLIITTMQLQVKKYITLPQSTDNLTSRAAVFFDLTNQFNSVSCQAFFNVIATSFPESSHSLLCSTNMLVRSIINELTALGALSSWKKELARAAPSHPSLHPSSWPASSNL
jgi:hypothetical protein